MDCGKTRLQRCSVSPSARCLLASKKTRHLLRLYSAERQKPLRLSERLFLGEPRMVTFPQSGGGR